MKPCLSLSRHARARHNCARALFARRAAALGFKVKDASDGLRRTSRMDCRRRRRRRRRAHVSGRAGTLAPQLTRPSSIRLNQTRMTTTPQQTPRQPVLPARDGAVASRPAERRQVVAGGRACYRRLPRGHDPDGRVQHAQGHEGRRDDQDVGLGWAGALVKAVGHGPPCRVEAATPTHPTHNTPSILTTSPFPPFSPPPHPLTPPPPNSPASARCGSATAAASKPSSTWSTRPTSTRSTPPRESLRRSQRAPRSQASRCWSWATRTICQERWARRS